MLVIAIVTLAASYGLGALLLTRLGEEARAPDEAFDAIVVLGCRVGPDGRPSHALRRRAQHAARLYRAGIALGGDATLATNLAWLLATDPDPAVRHAADALALAQRIVAGRPDDPSSHHTLAAALAENGRFPEAVDALTRAIALARAAGQTSTATLFEQRLATYRAGRPWRQ